MLIPIRDTDLITADNLASMREYYEYRRQGGGYIYNGTPFHQAVLESYPNIVLTSQSNVFVGILFEICLFKSIVNAVIVHIMNENGYQYSNNKHEYIRRSLISKYFSHEMAIGKYDEGYDFLLMNNESGLRIDAKVYGTRIIGNSQSCSSYNLFVDQEQYNRHAADAYIQGFVINQINQLSFYVAGWKYRDELIAFPNARNPAYGISVPNLNNINDLVTIIYENNFNPAQYHPF